jgi:NADP-dependent 3-hydroxy acid dehydrogenase YdfG
MSTDQDYARVAIVTGATSGIGEATARHFVSNGYAVIGNGRSADKLDALEGELGSNFAGVVGDAAEQEVIEAMFDTARNRFGRAADLVVANAGRGLGGAVTEVDVAEFEQVARLNVVGVLGLAQQAARSMVEAQAERFPHKPADIVMIGSVVGRNISPFSAVYGSTKFAVHALAEGLRREVGPKGVRVTLVEPGIVVSGFQDAAGYGDDLVQAFEDNYGPMLYGEDVARAVGFVVSQPPHVHINEIMVRPTRQDYP